MAPLNRRALDDRLEHAWRRSLRYATPICVMMIDVDYFKQFNDLYGHLTGDDCVIRVAGAIKELLRRPDDFVARDGGDEFVVIGDATDPQEARKLGERIRERVEQLGMAHAGSSVAPKVTVSVGVASGQPHRDVAVTDLIAAADRALYLAKQAGRNQVALHQFE